MFKYFLQKVNEPFPDKTTFRENIFDIILVGIFVTLFLYLLTPFEIGTYPGSNFLLCVGYGIITIIISSAYDLFITKILKIEKDIPSWTFKKWIFNVIGLITSIAVGNYLFTLFISNGLLFSFEMFSQIVMGTWIVGLLPIMFSGMMIQLRDYKANQIHASNITSNLSSANEPLPTPTSQPLTIFSSNKKNKLEVELENLLFVEAMQNYVSIDFLKEKKVEKEILRTTLSNVSQQLKDTVIIRCHRSYLVNPNQIQNVEGNAQGLKLTLRHLNNQFIPVSRKFISALKSYR